MPTLHDPAVLAGIESRLRALRPDAPRQWGTMRVDQMLWHVNCAMEQSLGRRQLREGPKPLPKALLRFVVLNFPWPRGAPTNPDLVAKGEFDFETERTRSLALVREFASRDLAAPWPRHADFGGMNGHQWSRFQVRHLDHHLRQFGA